MSTFLIILGFVCIVTGIVGSIFPVLPGPPLAYASLILIQFTDKQHFSTDFLVILAVVVAVVLLLDYMVPVWGTRKFGGSKYGAWGSTIGIFVGMFIGPFGIILGPFFGALIGELIGKKEFKDALKAAFGSFIGFLAGVMMKIALCLFIGYKFISALF